MHIDWSTLALQTINVLILVWILAKFLFRPLRDIIAKRQAQANAVLADADALKKQAAEAKAEAEKARKAIDVKRQQLLAEAQAEAAAEKVRIIEAARTEIGKERAEAAAAAAHEQKQMEEALMPRIKSLAVEIAQQLLGRLSPDAGLDGFIDELCAKLNDAPAATRAALQSDGNATMPIEVVTAAQLTAATNARLCEKLQTALGPNIALRFSVDPALIAGIELHGRTLSLSNSLRHDLDQIAGELDFGARF